MVYLLIIFIIALALAPLAHVVPNKYQRRVARLREAAALQGMFVEFRSLPEGAVTCKSGDEPRRGQTIYYGLRFSSADRTIRQPARWIYTRQGWCSTKRGGSVPAELEQLPPTIFAAEVERASCGVYWQEAGEEDAVAQIRDVLRQLRDIG